MKNQYKTRAFFLLFGILLLFNATIVAQEKTKLITLSKTDIEKIKNNEIKLNKWIENLKTPGVQKKGDSIFFSKEVIRLVSDSAYRKSVYKNYTFIDVKNSLSNMDIQKAFWQMIDLYPSNKKKVIQYIYAYDKILDVDKIIYSSFYTYAFFNPKIGTIVNGKVKIDRPDRLQADLRNVKEIIFYIEELRKKED